MEAVIKPGKEFHPRLEQIAIITNEADRVTIKKKLKAIF